MALNSGIYEALLPSRKTPTPIILMHCAFAAAAAALAASDGVNVTDDVVWAEPCSMSTATRGRLSRTPLPL